MENETIERNQYTTAGLVSFGNYLLSDERKANTSAENQQAVTDADIANWQATQTAVVGEGAEG